MNKRAAVIFLLSVSSGVLRAADIFPDPQEVPIEPGKRLPLEALDFFTQGGPRAISFRSDYLGGRPWEQFDATISQSFGHSPKMFDEETYFAPKNLPYMQKYAELHPEKLLLNHWNARELLANCEETKYFSPAHWLYFPGTVLQQAIGPAETNITVADGSRFLTVDKIHIKQTKEMRAKKFTGEGNDAVVIVPVESGKKVWEKAEYAVVLKRNKNMLTLQRGVLDTKPADHASGSYVAPLYICNMGADNRWGFAGTETCLSYNYALNCPRDALGRNCADAQAQLFYDWFKPGGPLERMHGIETDIFPWSLGSKKEVVADDNVGNVTVSRDRMIDADCDGVGDNGYSGDTNLFSLGVYDTLRKYRLVLGPERLFTADGDGPRWIRCLSFETGIEAESLTGFHDFNYRMWSSCFNIFQFWNNHCTQPHHFNLIVTKLTPPPGTPDVERALRERRRLAWAAAALMDVGIVAWSELEVSKTNKLAYKIYDEASRGADNVPGWLGKPVAPMLRLAMKTPDLLAGDGVRISEEFSAKWKSDNARIETKDGALRISPTARSSGDPVAHCGPLQIPKGDLFFRFLLKLDTLPGYPKDTFRYVTATLDGKAKAAELLGVGYEAGYAEVCFFYQNAGPGTVTLNLSFEGNAGAEIKEFTVHSASDVMVREYENGAVFANPSDEPYTFDLAALFPGKSFRRITSAEKGMSSGVNTGDDVGKTLTIPGLSGLFLIKK